MTKKIEVGQKLRSGFTSQLSSSKNRFIFRTVILTVQPNGYFNPLFSFVFPFSVKKKKKRKKILNQYIEILNHSSVSKHDVRWKPVLALTLPK